MGNELNTVRAVPRAVAAGFASSGGLTGLCMCLALSAGMNLISALQGALETDTDLLLRSPALFNLLYAAAAVFLVSRLWQLKGDVRGEKAQKAAVASLVLFGVMLMTVLFLGVLYFSIYSALGSMNAADLAEAGLTEENRQGMYSMLWYQVFVLGVSTLQAVCFVLFRGVLSRVSILFRGRVPESGIFTACGLVSAFTAGCCACVVLFRIMAGGNLLYVLTGGFSGLVEAGIYGCMAFLCQRTAGVLRGKVPA